MPIPPRVSVIVPAYNLARYLQAAIDSALAQADPGGPIQVIVVDDGSTDDTAEKLASYSDRIEVISQPNRGLVAAVDRGLEAVRGEFVALLDADDVWPRDRLRRHVEILTRSPELGLVHGDMEVVDADGSTLHPSFFAWKQEPVRDGRILPDLVKDNFVSGGALTFRASLLPAIHPIAAEAPYPDWWIAACVAAVAAIAHDPAVANLYRMHGANMGLGADRQRVLEIERRELPFRRWMMRNLIDDGLFTLQDVAATHTRWRQAVGLAGLASGGSVRGLLEADHEGAATAVAAALARPIGLSRCKALLRALACDPFDGVTSADLEIALMQAAEPQTTSASPPLADPPLITLRGCPKLTVAWLGELMRRPALLTAFAQETFEGDACTLAVLAPARADLSGLIALVESDPLLRDERCDIQVVTEPATTPARRLLSAWASSRVGIEQPVEPFTRLPLHASVERTEWGRTTTLAGAAG